MQIITKTHPLINIKHPLPQQQTQKHTQNLTNPPSSSTNNPTPQFPFHRYQLYFHFTFLIGVVIICVYNYYNYIIKHEKELMPTLQVSWLSKLMKQMNCSQVLYRYSADPQWQAYRSGLHVLFILALGWRGLTYIYELIDTFLIRRRQGMLASYSSKTLPINHFNYINRYISLLSIIFLLFAFRADIIFYLSLLFIWWLYVQLLIYIQKNKQQMIIIKKLSIQQLNTIMIGSLWVIMLGMLYLNEKYEHFRYISEYFQANLLPIQFEILKNSYRAIHCSQLLNMTFLRLVSYGVDRIKLRDPSYIAQQHQARIRKLQPCNESCTIFRPSSSHQNNQTSPQIIFYCYKGRDHLLKTHHSFSDYLRYTLFTPLLLTGPPISSNNFYSFSTLASPTITLKTLSYYLLLIFLFQIHQHIFPVINLDIEQSLIQMQIFSLLNLMFIWFKFLIIWRTAKIWAILYGVDVVDNMSRCVCNNYGFEGFWRMWHKGFNQWLIRYLYIPIGGNRNVLAVLVVVSFVAFWHDHTINIIFWALIISLFMVPEILIKRYFRKYQKHLYAKYWFKYLACFVSAVYIYFLVICNLIGFGYGLDKIGLLIQKLEENVIEFIVSFFVVMNAVMIMFYQRNLQQNRKNY